MNYYRERPDSEPRFVARNPSSSLAWHSEGWKAAAEILEAAYEKGNGGHANYLPYAIAGIWRQAIELQAKEVLYLAEELGDSSKVEDIWKDHSLSELGKRILTVLRQVKWTNSVASWQEILAELREWESTDPQGYMLRYPFNQRMAPYSWPQGAVDFSRAIACCRRASRLLTAIRIGIEEELFPDGD